VSKHWGLDGYDGLVAAQLFRLGCSVSSVAHKMLVDRTVVARFAQKLASLQSRTSNNRPTEFKGHQKKGRQNKGRNSELKGQSAKKSRSVTTWVPFVPRSRGEQKKQQHPSDRQQQQHFLSEQPQADRVDRAIEALVDEYVRRTVITPHAGFSGLVKTADRTFCFLNLAPASEYASEFASVPLHPEQQQHQQSDYAPAIVHWVSSFRRSKSAACYRNALVAANIRSSLAAIAKALEPLQAFATPAGRLLVCLMRLAAPPTFSSSALAPSASTSSAPSPSSTSSSTSSSRSKPLFQVARAVPANVVLANSVPAIAVPVAISVASAVPASTKTATKAAVRVEPATPPFKRKTSGIYGARKKTPKSAAYSETPKSAAYSETPKSAAYSETPKSAAYSETPKSAAYSETPKSAAYWEFGGQQEPAEITAMRAKLARMIA
jgi:hypothetical protein